jgi:proline racemase
MSRRIAVSAVDYHTAGEPFRIVGGGAPALVGDTILEKRGYAADHLDHLRELLVFEPRGHADMYGCFVTDPNDDGADLGVVFFHNAGYSTACGHGTIALVTWALESGLLPADGDVAQVSVDVPSGRLATTARIKNGRVESVRFRNVPSFVIARDIHVDTSRGRVRVDIAYGGAFYASVAAGEAGLSVEPDHVDDCIALGRELKAVIEAEHEIVHPLEPELRDIYGVIFYQDEQSDDLAQRNVTIFADGEVDRSPCGSGTSARLALLDRSQELPRGRSLRHLSIVDTVFEASVVADAMVGDIPAVITEVEGSAHLTGYHHFVLEDGDPLGTGFLLR